MLYKNYPERKRNEARKRHGWTQEAVEIALVQQNNKCAICNEVFTAMPCADHAHTTPPTPRGLLCRKHNLLLGHANDDVAILEASIAYLKKYGDKQ
jgi:SAM-dependent MidA family methyltransferase